MLSARKPSPTLGMVAIMVGASQLLQKAFWSFPFWRGAWSKTMLTCRGCWDEERERVLLLLLLDEVKATRRREPQVIHQVDLAKVCARKKYVHDGEERYGVLVFFKTLKWIGSNYLCLAQNDKSYWPFPSYRSIICFSFWDAQCWTGFVDGKKPCLVRSVTILLWV